MILDAIPRIPAEPNWPEHLALDSALVTDRKLWPGADGRKLEADFGAVSERRPASRPNLMAKVSSVIAQSGVSSLVDRFAERSDLRFFMGSGHGNAQARGAFCHGWITNCRH